MMKIKKLSPILLALGLLLAFAISVGAQADVTNLGRTVWSGLLDANGNCIDLDADADTSICADTDDRIDFEASGSDQASMTATQFDVNDLVLNQDLGVENIGGLPTVLTVAITTTDKALATIADGEIWIVHDVFIKVATNYNCTGDDCTLVIGDGNDTDGFLTLTDAQLQAADTEYTGAAAGWQGLAAATKGVYLDEVTTNAAHRHIYAPSGAAETIDLDIGGTSPAAGTGTVYILYTRIQ